MEAPVAEVIVRPGNIFGMSLISYLPQIQVASRRETKAVSSVQHLVRSGSYSDCGQHLCLGDRRGNILLVAAKHADDWNKYQSIPVHQSTVRGITSLPGTSQFVSCGEDGRLGIIDGKGSSAETLLDKLPAKLVSCTGITRSTVASGGTNNKIYVIDIPTRRITQILNEHQGTVVGLASNQSMLASVGFDCKVILWRRQDTAGPDIDQPNITGLAKTATREGG
ncbi:MAG: hypothetical protein ACF8AM_10505 [Rhodopirellula sp. JB055]|uniref:hypothetical protein n=1 Tax=Rhodopirellula sp. JB055 TaxID=3342846 RepID=UPI00370BABEB